MIRLLQLQIRQRRERIRIPNSPQAIAVRMWTQVRAQAVRKTLPNYRNQAIKRRTIKDTIIAVAMLSATRLIQRMVRRRFMCRKQHLLLRIRATSQPRNTPLQRMQTQIQMQETSNPPARHLRISSKTIPLLLTKKDQTRVRQQIRQRVVRFLQRPCQCYQSRRCLWQILTSIG
ncbi:hypothetical protein D3C80_1539330 [compost metagenome]